MDQPTFYDEEKEDSATVGAHAANMTNPNAEAASSPRNKILEEIQSKKPKKRELPSIHSENSHYSSTLVMLKKTQQQVEEFGSEFSAFHTILTLPGSAELKRTVAKMFADQKNAEAVSNAEWKRREAEYKEQKTKLNEKQLEQTRKDKDLLQKELQALKE
eukprot:PhF_6_TR25391/c0_g1_i1/m.35109